MNMLATIVPKSDQLNSDDLIGCTKTITVTRVSINPSSEQPVSIGFEGDNGKPYKPGKSMRRVLVKVWGADASTYAGRSMTLYREDGVRFGGMEVGGIRISHMSHIDAPQTMALTEKKGSKKPFTVKPLKVEQAQDKAADGTDALVKRIQAAGDMDALAGITAEPAVIKQRGWLAANRPELAERVNQAVGIALAGFEEHDEPENLLATEGEAA
jgi:hypothetical protein